ncbi:NERD domain-containing protein [Niallia sp. Sow4_A1]|uniref:NERD domain-containing protein n=1 Tax=Niallia hominis TaxID=3133173 RepID=A0ABV1EZW0_9BACI|nr:MULTISPECIES: NERD domain-containing protein [Bacillaceae]MCM3362504.1 NERD domain-containing protein [Niallia sp. MER TA 168]CAI9393729.1 DNA topoisomerase 1 [Bacillus sp. T2.9-1]
MIGIFALLLFLVIANRFYPTIKGFIGEMRVNKLLSKLEFPYKQWRDLYVPNSKRGMSQIDHVLFGKNALFIIETKNYQGWIYGSENSQTWTQAIYKKKHKFKNPIWQNYGHIQAIKEYLSEEIPENFPIYSIIVFSNEATLKYKTPFKKASVINNRKLLSTIKELDVPFIQETINRDTIENKLNSLLISDKKQKKKVAKNHIKSIQSEVKTNKKKVKQNICPHCGNSLVQRKGKNGPFTGCSNFPKCRYTKAI